MTPPLDDAGRADALEWIKAVVGPKGWTDAEAAL